MKEETNEMFNLLNEKSKINDSSLFIDTDFNIFNLDDKINFDIYSSKISEDEINQLYRSPDINKNLKINMTNSLNKQEKIRQKRLKNNECAKKYRLKRKGEFESLLAENKKLKMYIYNRNIKLNLVLCSKCKEKLGMHNTFICHKNESDIINNNLDDNQSENNINSNSDTDSNCKSTLNNNINNSSNSASINILEPNNNINITRYKPFTFFISILVIICVLYDLSFSSNFNNHIKYYSYKNNKNIHRSLTKNDFYVNLDMLKTTNITFDNYYVTLGDYFSITHQNNFLEQNFKFSNNGPVRILKNEEMFFFNQTECTNCILEIDQSNIQLSKEKMSFRLFLTPNKAWQEKFSKDDNTWNEKQKLDAKYFFEINCEINGFSLNKRKEIN